jgi:hypothetical protein
MRRNQIFTMVAAPALLAISLLAQRSRADIFVTQWATDGTNGPGTGAVVQYTNSGQLITNSLITGLNHPEGIAVVGNSIYVADWGANRVGKYVMGVTPGTLASSNPTFATGLNGPGGIAANDSFVFVANQNSGTVAQYTASGTLVNGSLISGLGYPTSVIVDGGDLYVASASTGKIGKYTLGITPGTISVSNPNLVTGLPTPNYLAISGNDLFVVNGNGTVGMYSTAGVPEFPSLISGLTEGPSWSIAALGSSLYIVGDNTSTNPPGNGTAKLYSTSGALINGALLPAMQTPMDIAVTPEPASLFVLAAASMMLLTRRRADRATRIQA